MTIDAAIGLRIGNFLLDAKLSGHGMILLTGENGSGKTTFLRALAGHYPEMSGHVVINGEEVTSMDITSRRIVYINQESYFPSLNVDQHLSWPSGSDTSTESLNSLKERFAINYTGRASHMSTGQRIRLSVATALLHRPRLMLLDEVTANLSDADIFLGELRNHLAESEADLIYVSQNADHSGFADEHYEMRNGSISRLLQRRQE